MLFMFPLYIFLFIFDMSFFSRDHKGNKTFQVFCAFPVAIVFSNVFHNSSTFARQQNKPTFLPR